MGRKEVDREVDGNRAVGLKEPEGQETDQRIETLKILTFHRWEESTVIAKTTPRLCFHEALK